MNGLRASALEKVKGKAAGLSTLAMSMALPHENKAVRLPLVPVTQTSVLELMSDTSITVSDAGSRRYVLFRDPCYPLWGDITLESTGFVFAHSQNFVIPAVANIVIPTPVLTGVGCLVSAGSKIDGQPFVTGFATDRYPVGKIDGEICAYVPTGSFFIARMAGTFGNDQTGKFLEADFKYLDMGEWMNCTLLLEGNAAGFIFAGSAGTGAPPQGAVKEGNAPKGFVKCTAIRTSTVAPVAENNPVWQYGMGSGGWADTGGGAWRPTGTAIPLFPLFRPPEFENSQLPYAATRATATAALFTNVTAALSKEGTILAARLRPSTADPWGVTTATLNAVHPRLRYYGPLEKGLYTFTTPTAQDASLQESVLNVPCAENETVFSKFRPCFSIDRTGYYNAMIFTDTGNSTNGTILATSLYTHLEFESTSSLFTPGVSTFTLEQLHAAEVALLQFGHFHENPLHWAAIRAAAGAALRYVGPMVAPIVQQVGTSLLSKGVAYLKGQQASGDRTMKQAQMVVPAKHVARIKAKPKPKPAPRKRK